jgi:hypothetical protein
MGAMNRIALYSTRGENLARDLIGADAIAAQQHDLGPPDMFL